MPVEYSRADGSIAGDHVRLVDFGDVGANDWLAVNQFTVIEGQHNRRPDIVAFVNGLPLGLIEPWFGAKSGLRHRAISESPAVGRSRIGRSEKDRGVFPEMHHSDNMSA